MWSGDAQQTDGAVVELLDRPVGGLELIKNMTDTIKIDQSGFRQTDLAGRAVKQPRVEACFEFRDVLADCRARQPHPISGSCEAVGFRNGSKHFEGGQFVHGLTGFPWQQPMPGLPDRINPRSAGVFCKTAITGSDYPAAANRT